MAEIDNRLIGQGSKLLQRMPHVHGRALEEPSAAQRKQGIGGKEQHVLGQMIADVSCGVAGCFDHPHRAIAKGELVTVPHGPVDARNGSCLVTRTDDLAAVFFLQRQVRLDMVTVVMGGEDMGDLPAPLLRRLDDRIELRSVDRCRFPRLRAVKKHAEVVTSAEEYLDLQ